MISKKLYTLKVNWGFSTTRLHTSLQHSTNQDKSQFQSTKCQLDELTWIIRHSNLFIIVFVDKELPIKQCSEISCNGRGDCLNLAEGGFTCICHEEYTGAECNFSMYSCHLDPCHNNENCTVGISGTVSCLCYPGWSGQFCSDGLLRNEFTLIIIIRYIWMTNSVNLIVTLTHFPSHSCNYLFKLGSFESEMMEICVPFSLASYMLSRSQILSQTVALLGGWQVWVQMKFRY